MPTTASRKWSKKHPTRLRGLAHLPMQDPDAAIVELERVVREHKFKGVEVGTSIEGRPLADERFRKVLKTIEQLDCFLSRTRTNAWRRAGWTTTTSPISSVFRWTPP